MENKERILAKAHDLFLQYGFRSVSMDDIANHLGMSKKTLYQHFADKDDLVDEVVALHIDEIQADCIACRNDARDAIHEILNIMDRIIEQFSNMNPMLLYDMEKFHFKAFQRFRNHKEKFLLQVIWDNMEWGIREGLYRPDINLDLMSKFRIESMMIPFNVAMFPPGKYNLAVTSGLVLENFIYGLTTLKGHKLFQKYIEQRQKQHQHENARK